MTMDFVRPRASSPLVTIARMLGGAAIGGAAAWGYITHATELRVADVVALVLALVCMIGAVRLWGDSFNRAALAKMISVEGETSDEETHSIRLQAAMMALLGIGLIWPPLATFAGFPAPWWAYAVVIVSLAANMWFTIRIMGRSDEYVRHRLMEMTFRASMVGQVLLIAYAGAERLGLAPAATAWDVLVMFTTVSLLTPLFSMPKKNA